MNTRRESRVYVGVLPHERPAFVRVASAMGLDMSGAVRALVLERDRKLARRGSERTFAANGANNVARDASGKSG